MTATWNQRIRRGTGLLFLFLTLAALPVGCDYSDDTPATDVGSGSFSPGMVPVPSFTPADATERNAADPEQGVKRAAILKSTVDLIQSAALKPGGDHFKVATLNLNQVFSGTSPSQYAMSDEARAFLLQHYPEPFVRSLEAAEFGMMDARHLEDCMMYYRIASRVAGTGDDLTRVRRVFDWMVRQVQLIPANSLATNQLPQAQARPYDILLRGMAVESGGSWAERAWLFLALCRQLGLDAGLLRYSPRGDLQRLTPLSIYEPLRREAPIVWVCAVLIDGKAYLFDARIGLPIPGADGTGVATLDDALRDPRVLDQLDLPGESSYGTSRAALLGSPTKIDVLLDSSPGYVSTKMKLLQTELQGADRSILYRDPADQAQQFAAALGPHFGAARFWELPLSVYNQLFSNPKFVEAAQQALFLFRADFPLVYARVKQLRGELPEATEDYVKFRFAEHAQLVDKKGVAMPADVQKALDIYATYYLGLTNLERNNPKQAEFFFRETLRLLPEPAGHYYYHMFRWGAETNLARLLEARGDLEGAIPYYTQPQPTKQYHGNLVRARALIWRDPTAPVPAPLPPPPPADAGG